MAQGKLKIKSKVPDNTKTKKKGKGTTQKRNRPIQPKKLKKSSENIKQAITAMVNKKVEADIRSRAIPNKANLSKVQEVVATYNKSK